MIKEGLTILAIQQVMEHLRELDQRRVDFQQARDYSDSVGKPLLVVGTPKFVFNHPCGDVTIDINPDVAKWCDTEIADVRAIPYPDQYFGAAFISHVLEHLPTVQDAYDALEELHRVAEKVFVVSPSKLILVAWLHPEHHLWVTPDGEGFIIEQRGKTLATAASII